MALSAKKAAEKNKNKKNNAGKSFLSGVKVEMKKLLDNYNQKEKHSFEEIVEFHVELKESTLSKMAMAELGD